MTRFLVLALALTGAAAAGELDSGIQTAIERALAPLEKTAPIFWKNTGCVSCHQVTLPTMAIAMARQHGFRVGRDAEQQISKITADYVNARAERILQGITPPGAEDTLSYVVFGLAMAQLPASRGTDASARYLKIRQADDGRWKIRAHRPPLEASAISLTAVTIRVLEAYAPPGQRQQYQESIDRGARWLAQAEARNTEETAFKILGLVWAQAGAGVVRQESGRLATLQRADGGWSQLPTLASDAYATGQALMALQAAGMNTADAAYQRGASFLVKTQLADGSWHVKSRSEAFQPYFESGFPHGHDQWISAAGSSWAVAALALTRPPAENSQARAANR